MTGGLAESRGQRGWGWLCECRRRSRRKAPGLEEGWVAKNWSLAFLECELSREILRLRLRMTGGLAGSRGQRGWGWLRECGGRSRRKAPGLEEGWVAKNWSLAFLECELSREILRLRLRMTGGLAESRGQRGWGWLCECRRRSRRKAPGLEEGWVAKNWSLAFLECELSREILRLRLRMTGGLAGSRGQRGWGWLRECRRRSRRKAPGLEEGWVAKNWSLAFLECELSREILRLRLRMTGGLAGSRGQRGWGWLCECGAGLEERPRVSKKAGSQRIVARVFGVRA